MGLGFSNKSVVLLHGIGHCRFHMMGLAWALRRKGWRVYNVSYPSCKMALDDLADFVADRLESLGIWGAYDRVDFVAHSLGGLVTGKYLLGARAGIPDGKLGRVVMLGTPFGGSEVADALKGLWPYQAFFGAAGQELASDVRQADVFYPYYDLGVIAGDNGWFHPGAIWMSAPHDGCVNVESTQIDGLADHIVMPVHHSFMAWSGKVYRQVIHFLDHGEFDP